VGFVAANPTKAVPSWKPSLTAERAKASRHTDSTVQMAAPVGGRLHLSARGHFFSPACLHWFRQCTRPIHSARAPQPSPDVRPCRKRTKSIRRQSAATGSSSPELPPVTASLPTKNADASCVDDTSPDGVFGCLRRKVAELRCRSDDLQPSIPTAPRPFRSCTPGHHSRLFADGSRLPCRAQPTVLVLRRLCPSLRPEHRSAPAEFYSGHTPPLRLFTRYDRERHRADARLREIAHVVRFVCRSAPRLLPPGRPSQAPGCQTRRPQWLLR